MSEPRARRVRAAPSHWSLCWIPRITHDDLCLAMKSMARGESTHHFVFSFEVILHSGNALHLSNVSGYKRFLENDEADQCWAETVFTLVPKAGDLQHASNWKPIAILRVLYKLFARTIYNRVRPKLESQESEEQMGFRRARGTNDAHLFGKGSFEIN